MDSAAFFLMLRLLVWFGLLVICRFVGYVLLVWLLAQRLLVV